jgi:hypothetical protein
MAPPPEKHDFNKARNVGGNVLSTMIPTKIFPRRKEQQVVKKDMKKPEI